MTRSPLAYPLNRSADMDAGGAADLQTDIMRFMAILSLCLVAVFALVQSIPMQPAQPANPVASVAPAKPVEQPAAVAAITGKAVIVPVKPPPASIVETKAEPSDPVVSLTRPKWVPKFEPKRRVEKTATARADPPTPTDNAIPTIPVEVAATPVENQTDGFTLRFESDAALTRLVAANRIGVYAVGDGRAQRMTVSENRISFWDASTPNSYHEMEISTVPVAVIDALGRAGTPANEVSWGVTLPGRLKTQLDELMLEHRGGALIIISSGDIRWEAS